MYVDGLVGEWVELQNLLPLNLNNKAFDNSYKFALDDKKLKKVLHKSIIDDLSKDGHAIQVFEEENTFMCLSVPRAPPKW